MFLIILIFVTFVNINLFANIGTYGFKDFPNYYFVETGAFGGDGIKKALEANCFNQIYSIEINLNCIIDCDQKFRNFNNIQLIQGDSKEVLWDVIKKLDKPITFWLDAHIYPPIYDGKEKKNSPIMEELEQIKKHHLKNHTILIDDLSCCNTLAFDYVTVNDLINKIKEINPKYTISFLAGGDNDEVPNNILLAKVLE